MYRIIYLSSAVSPLSVEAINLLLKQSREFNIKNNISGVLFYIDSDFFQVIEGSKEVLITLFEKIKKDVRHKGILCVFSDNVEDNLFPDWSMGFCHSDYKKLREIAGLETINKKELFAITDQTALAFMTAFINSHRDKIILV